MAQGTEIASFYASIGANTDGLMKGLEQTKSAMSGLQSGFSQLQDIGKNAMVALGAAVAGIATSVAVTGFQFDAMKESSQIAFTTMLGSGEAAQGMLDDLQAFAQKTPFEFPDLIKASQRFMAMGFAASDVIPTLTAVGDAVAAMGGSAELVDRVTTAIGQMNAKGKASGDEMRQLTEAGIPVWQMLADKIGITVPEAMKQVSAGAVSAGTAITAITSGIETRFGGMMDAQSHTFMGMISNIKDGFTQMSGTIMMPFFDMAKVSLGNLATGITRMSSSLQEGNSIWDAFGLLMANLLDGQTALWDMWVKTREIMEGITAVVKAIASPLADLTSKFFDWGDVVGAVGVVIGSVLASIVIAWAPVIAAFAAVVVAIAALRYAWENDFMGVKTFTQGVLKDIGDWFSNGTGIWKGTWKDTIYGSGGIQPTLITWAISSRERLASWVQWAKDTFEGWKSDVIQTFTIWKDRILSTWDAWTGPTLHAVEVWATDVKGKIGNWIDWVLKDFNDWKDDVIKLFEPVIDWWHDHIQPWIDAGRDLVQGLWDGIRDKWYEFTNWFQGVWTDLKTRFQNFFGIHSPSKLFADYGENMMQGLAKGIGAGQNAVHGALDGMSAGITSNVAATHEYAMMPSSSGPSAEAVLMQRNNDLLVTLIQTLQSKNMTANVTVQGGGGAGLGALVNTTNGLR